MLTHEKDFLVLFGDSFVCPNFALCSMSKLDHVKMSWLWKIKIYVWQFRSGAMYSSDVVDKQLYEKILDCKMQVSSRVT